MPTRTVAADATVDLPADDSVERNAQGFDEVDRLGRARPRCPRDRRPGALWDPLPVTLPTYVTKPAATRRTVRTIDLDATGVWTSGRTDADSAIAREADAAAKAARERAAKATTSAVGS